MPGTHAAVILTRSFRELSRAVSRRTESKAKSPVRAAPPKASVPGRNGKGPSLRSSNSFAHSIIPRKSVKPLLSGVPPAIKCLRQVVRLRSLASG